MNGHTAKMVNRYTRVLTARAVAAGASRDSLPTYRDMKRAWTQLPRPVKRARRLEMGLVLSGREPGAIPAVSQPP